MALFLIISCFLACVVIHLILRRRLPRGTPSLPLPPGPRGFPILGALPFISPLPHTGLARLARRHGPIMYLKLGVRNVVVASSTAAACAFLKTFDVNFSNRPIGIITRAIAYDGKDMAMADYGTKWKLLRKVSTLHLLGGKALARWAGERRNEVGLMLQSMLKMAESGKPLLLTDMLICAQANIIGRITMSQRVFDEQGKESKEFKEAIRELQVGAVVSNITDLVPAIGWIDPLGIRKRMWRVHDRFDTMITKLLAEHSSMAGERQKREPDFIDLIAAYKPTGEDGEELSEENIKGFILDLFVAGTDTVANVTEWAMAEMLKNPGILCRVQAEADAAIGRNRLFEESDIPNLPYLQAVCKETLRMHPPAPLGIPHFTYEPCEVEGYRIPGNTWLLVNNWAIGNDPDVWENPLEFDPERFLTGKAAKIEPFGNHFELIPFGAGRRICAGKQLGMLMVQYFLGTLLISFDWSLPEGVEEVNMEEGLGLSLPMAVPLSAVATPRLAPAAYGYA